MTSAIRRRPKTNQERVEESTLALIAHHFQAGYYGMRNGRLLIDGSPDDVIRGTARDPSRFGELDDDVLEEPSAVL